MVVICIILTVVQIIYILYYFIGYQRFIRQLKIFFILIGIVFFNLGYFYMDSIITFWTFFWNSDFYELICMAIIIQVLFVLYHSRSLNLVRNNTQKLIFFIGVCFLVFSLIIIELGREIYHLFVILETFGEGKTMFYWEWQRGLLFIVNNISCLMALTFINMMVVLIVLFCQTHRLKNI